MAHHVFVETNWVVDFVAPVLARDRAATELADKARDGTLQLHVPSISLAEARKVVREKSPKQDLNGLRSFLRIRGIERAENEVVQAWLSRYEQYIAEEKREAPGRIASLLEDSMIDAFALTDEMLRKSLELAAATSLELQSFDMAILSAVLVFGEQLRTLGHDVSFCTTDRDLQPWDKQGNMKQQLVEQYDEAGIWVYGDYLLESPPRRDGWELDSE